MIKQEFQDDYIPKESKPEKAAVKSAKEVKKKKKKKVKKSDSSVPADEPEPQAVSHIIEVSNGDVAVSNGVEPQDKQPQDRSVDPVGSNQSSEEPPTRKIKKKVKKKKRVDINTSLPEGEALVVTEIIDSQPGMPAGQTEVLVTPVEVATLSERSQEPSATLVTFDTHAGDKPKTSKKKREGRSKKPKRSKGDSVSDDPEHEKITSEALSEDPMRRRNDWSGEAGLTGLADQNGSGSAAGTMTREDFGVTSGFPSESHISNDWENTQEAFFRGSMPSRSQETGNDPGVPRKGKKGHRRKERNVPEANVDPTIAEESRSSRGDTVPGFAPRNMRLSESRDSLEEVLDGLLVLNSSRDGRLAHDEDRLLPEETPLDRAMRLLQRPSSDPTSGPSSEKDQDIEAQKEVHFAMTSSDQPEAALIPGQEDVLVRCRNPKCKKTAPLMEAKKTYKTCHNCYTYYCSRQCRKAHWERHKMKCLYSRVNSGCKHVIRKVHDDDQIGSRLSRVARSGFLTRGRGCVMLVFSSLRTAEDFFDHDILDLESCAAYATASDVHTLSNNLGEHLFELLDMIRTYNPEVKYVLEVAILAGDDSTSGTLPRKEGPIIKKCAKLRLCQTQQEQPINAQRIPDVTVTNADDTLILTAVPGSEFTEDVSPKKAREICFANIQRKLRQRGVSLRHQFPEVYGQLCQYVENNDHFTPITLFPTDPTTGKQFMCCIMPESEPEVEWSSRTDVLEQVGIGTVV